MIYWVLQHEVFFSGELDFCLKKHEEYKKSSFSGRPVSMVMSGSVRSSGEHQYPASASRLRSNTWWWSSSIQAWHRTTRTPLLWISRTNSFCRTWRETLISCAEPQERSCHCGSAHQAEGGGKLSPPVVVAAAELEVEQQSVVRHQVETVCVHQSLAAQRVARFKAWRVNPTWTKETSTPSFRESQPNNKL